MIAKIVTDRLYRISYQHIIDTIGNGLVEIFRLRKIDERGGLVLNTIHSIYVTNDLIRRWVRLG